MARRASKDRPYVDNYPPLSTWLEEHGARCQSQLPIGDSEDPQAYLEIYLINGRQCVVLVHAYERGWELFTPAASDKITATLHDAELRLGLTSKS